MRAQLGRDWRWSQTWKIVAVSREETQGAYSKQGKRGDKTTARANYQMIQQGGYKSITVYKERPNFVLKAYEDQGNKKLADPDFAMDFFQGLDNAHYATFKTDYINGLTSKAIDPLKDLNEIYLLAN